VAALISISNQPGSKIRTGSWKLEVIGVSTRFRTGTKRGQHGDSQFLAQEDKRCPISSSSSVSLSWHGRRILTTSPSSTSRPTKGKVKSRVSHETTLLHKRSPTTSKPGTLPRRTKCKKQNYRLQLLGQRKTPPLSKFVLNSLGRGVVADLPSWTTRH
jgi:hypothetical protein